MQKITVDLLQKVSRNGIASAQVISEKNKQLIT